MCCLSCRVSHTLDECHTLVLFLVLLSGYQHFLLGSLFPTAISSHLRAFILAYWVFKFLKKMLFILFLDRGREGEKQGERHQWVVTSCQTPAGDLACNPGMCPDWKPNWWPFSLQMGTQSTEPHQPGLAYLLFLFFNFYCYSTRIVCLFSPSLQPTPTESTSLPHLHPPPWVCPCVLHRSSYNSLFPCPPPRPPGYC